ncbi:glutaredoxin-like protein [Candidatus Methanoperedens nitroreducens]|uniref:Glutaredoxin-like protein n=1 Tax=Candidatus Methanoperedens nitratireducens TaxID=1392998 RepID=A0A062VAX5_9EURY|nr:glutaredoxin family protein [Candidatus Methanoperedens nitroreducens]KCZ72450.1 glutaredoxin-like protein [Candidatus Methanoperedens nitroreducens]MDJ1423616.1 glutaredoxin family protein [Candidatus Methanoperedens sp.]
MGIKPKLYTLSTCMHCRAAKRFLKANGIEYDYVDVDKLGGKEKEEVSSEVIKISGGLRFPTIVIGDKVIVGFYENKLREALGL